jgi:RimJ/RimL family protein N-acetyltransferase
MEGESIERPGYRVRLRGIRETDVDAIMTWINDPDVTKHFAAFDRVVTRADELRFVAAMRASPSDCLFAIERVLGDGAMIGTVGLHQIYRPAQNARLGIMLGGAGARGAGLGQEALRLVIAYAFERLGLHKVWMVHYAANERMQHIAHKLGFRVEGCLRDEYFHRDAWHDMVRQGLLATEWAHLGRA